jgi:hypothetical protein
MANGIFHFRLDNYIQRVKNATIKLTHVDLPTYLYEEGPYQSSEPDRGLLRGHCLLRVSPIDTGIFLYY